MTGTSFFNRNKTDVLFVRLETSTALINQLKINMCDNKSEPLDGKKTSEPMLIRGDVLFTAVECTSFIT